jgi:hypothetical protein
MAMTSLRFLRSGKKKTPLRYLSVLHVTPCEIARALATLTCPLMLRLCVAHPIENWAEKQNGAPKGAIFEMLYRLHSASERKAREPESDQK